MNIYFQPVTHCPKLFQTPTSMRTHRVNTHDTVPDIMPGHPQGHGSKNLNVQSQLLPDPQTQ